MSMMTSMTMLPVSLDNMVGDRNWGEYCKFENFREGFIFAKLAKFRENKILVKCRKYTILY